jgi:hypothetical protein
MQEPGEKNSSSYKMSGDATLTERSYRLFLNGPAQHLHQCAHSPTAYRKVHQLHKANEGRAKSRRGFSEKCPALYGCFVSFRSV